MTGRGTSTTARSPAAAGLMASGLSNLAVGGRVRASLVAMAPATRDRSVPVTLAGVCLIGETYVTGRLTWLRPHAATGDPLAVHLGDVRHTRARHNLISSQDC
jgi:hypothetical protein